MSNEADTIADLALIMGRISGYGQDGLANHQAIDDIVEGWT